MTTLTGPQLLDAFHASAGRIVFDRRDELALCLVCLLAGGHLLIEDEPGVGKTTLVKVLATLCGLQWRRIQCTNDMLPSDILGTHIWNAQEHLFVFHPGPMFSQLVMADELNRASARTQSATLQAMEEREVTLDGVTHALPIPFFFVATQNPQTSAGTQGLPESQIDRFHMAISLGRPDRATQRKLVDREAASGKEPYAVSLQGTPALTTTAQLLACQSEVRRTTLSEPLKEYILDCLAACESRDAPLSPRALLALVNASRAHAWISGRTFTAPEDVKAVFVAVVAHRIGLKKNLAQAAARTCAQDILAQVAVR